MTITINGSYERAKICNQIYGSGNFFIIKPATFIYFRWHKEFTNGQRSCESQGAPGVPITALTEEPVNTEAVILLRDPRLTTRNSSILLNICWKNFCLLFLYI